MNNIHHINNKTLCISVQKLHASSVKVQDRTTCLIIHCVNLCRLNGVESTIICVIDIYMHWKIKFFQATLISLCIISSDLQFFYLNMYLNTTKKLIKVRKNIYVHQKGKT